MTESQLYKGNNLSEKIKKLKTSRLEFKTSFDIIHKEFNRNPNAPKTRTSHQIFFYHGNGQKSNYFPIDELLKLYEYRIKQLDLSIEEFEREFEQL